MIKPELLDVVNFAICEAVDDYLGEKATKFFEKVGEYHLEEAMRRGLVKFEPHDKPLDALLKIARYLESAGYMERIVINKLSDNEAQVEMHGVSVTESSVRILGEKKNPSHFMTNVMFAGLKKLGVEAELKEVEFDREQKRFKEHWKILESMR